MQFKILLATSVVLFSLPSPAQSTEQNRAVLEAHAAFAHAIYSESITAAEKLRDRVKALCAKPSAQALSDARTQWTAARKIYGRTEVLRFYGGPIDNRRDGTETFLNAWPLDEAYVDRVVGAPEAGIINDPKRYPILTGAILTAVNERGGEANVSIGWHAIEFLLWGQDLSKDGPGNRSHEDFVDGKAPNADRRRAYLITVSELLIEHLRFVRDQWIAGQDNYRKTFVAAAPDRGLRRILTGALVLSGFELAGERMAVALETGEEEDEHSCFSDTTTNDMIANQEGIAMVWHGSHPSMKGIGLRTAAIKIDPAAAKEVDRLIAAGLEAVRGLPRPFDHALGKNPKPEAKKALERAVLAIEVQAEALAAVGLAMGHDIPLTPGG